MNGLLPRDVAQLLITKLDGRAIGPREAQQHALQYYGTKLTGRTRDQVVKSIISHLKETQA